jgi:opacity protein-like surface antigen
MKSFLLGIAAAAVFATAAHAVDIGGSYRVVGKNPDGSEYTGTAEIVVTSKNTCRISWTTGGSTSEGICMRNGIAFAASYVLGKDVGLVIYEVNNNGSMDGIWTIADTEGVGSESLIPR